MPFFNRAINNNDNTFLEKLPNDILEEICLFSGLLSVIQLLRLNKNLNGILKNSDRIWRTLLSRHFPEEIDSDPSNKKKIPYAKFNERLLSLSRESKSKKHVAKNYRARAYAEFYLVLFENGFKETARIHLKADPYMAYYLPSIILAKQKMADNYYYPAILDVIFETIRNSQPGFFEKLKEFFTRIIDDQPSGNSSYLKHWSMFYPRTKKKLKRIFANDVIDVVNKFHETFLIVRVKFNDSEGVEILLDKYEENRHKFVFKDEQFSVALHWAVYMGNPDIYLLLKKAGARFEREHILDEVFIHYREANYLHFACAGGNVEIINDIIGWYKLKFSDFLAENTQNFPYPPIYMALRYGKFDLFHYLLNQYIEQEPNSRTVDLKTRILNNLLTIAAREANLDLVKFLVKEGAQVLDGDLLLIHTLIAGASEQFFVSLGCIGMVFTPTTKVIATLKYFIEKGVNLDKANNEGKTPFHVAKDNYDKMKDDPKSSNRAIVFDKISKLLQQHKLDKENLNTGTIHELTNTPLRFSF